MTLHAVSGSGWRLACKHLPAAAVTCRMLAAGLAQTRTMCLAKSCLGQLFVQHLSTLLTVHMHPLPACHKAWGAMITLATMRLILTARSKHSASSACLYSEMNSSLEP